MDVLGNPRPIVPVPRFILTLFSGLHRGPFDGDPTGSWVVDEFSGKGFECSRKESSDGRMEFRSFRFIRDHLARARKPNQQQVKRPSRPKPNDPPRTKPPVQP